MIAYLTGDATRPETAGPVVIVHVVNDIGAWGSGFVLAVSRRWPQPERAYRAWPKPERRLGAVQFVPVASPDPNAPWWVANLVGQHGIRSRVNPTPVRYTAIADGLALVAAHAVEHGASVHMPRIGCDRGGGHWREVEPLITGTLVAAGVPVTVYDLPRRR